jgi:ATP/ADP translocase
MFSLLMLVSSIVSKHTIAASLTIEPLIVMMATFLHYLFMKSTNSKQCELQTLHGRKSLPRQSAIAGTKQASFLSHF